MVNLRPTSGNWYVLHRGLGTDYPGDHRADAFLKNLP